MFGFGNKAETPPKGFEKRVKAAEKSTQKLKELVVKNLEDAAKADVATVFTAGHFDSRVSLEVENIKAIEREFAGSGDENVEKMLANLNTQKEDLLSVNNALSAIITGDYEAFSEYSEKGEVDPNSENTTPRDALGPQAEEVGAKGGVEGETKSQEPKNEGVFSGLADMFAPKNPDGSPKENPGQSEEAETTNSDERSKPKNGEDDEVVKPAVESDENDRRSWKNVLSSPAAILQKLGGSKDDVTPGMEEYLKNNPVDATEKVLAPEHSYESELLDKRKEFFDAYNDFLNKKASGAEDGSVVGRMKMRYLGDALKDETLPAELLEMKEEYLGMAAAKKMANYAPVLERYKRVLENKAAKNPEFEMLSDEEIQQKVFENFKKNVEVRERNVQLEHEKVISAESLKTKHKGKFAVAALAAVGVSVLTGNTTRVLMALTGGLGTRFGLKAGLKKFSEEKFAKNTSADQAEQFELGDAEAMRKLIQKDFHTLTAKERRNLGISNAAGLAAGVASGTIGDNYLVENFSWAEKLNNLFDITGGGNNNLTSEALKEVVKPAEYADGREGVEHAGETLGVPFQSATADGVSESVIAAAPTPEAVPVFTQESLVDADVRGAIQTFENLKSGLADLPQTDVVEKLQSMEAHEIAQEYGFYNPEADAESANILAGDKIGFDNDGNLVYRTATGDTILETVGTVNNGVEGTFADVGGDSRVMMDRDFSGPEYQQQSPDAIAEAVAPQEPLYGQESTVAESVGRNLTPEQKAGVIDIFNDGGSILKGDFESLIGSGELVFDGQVGEQGDYVYLINQAGNTEVVEQVAASNPVYEQAMTGQQTSAADYIENNSQNTNSASEAVFAKQLYPDQFPGHEYGQVSEETINDWLNSLDRERQVGFAYFADREIWNPIESRIPFGGQEELGAEQFKDVMIKQVLKGHEESFGQFQEIFNSETNQYDFRFKQENGNQILLNFGTNNATGVGTVEVSMLQPDNTYKQLNVIDTGDQRWNLAQGLQAVREWSLINPEASQTDVADILTGQQSEILVGASIDSILDEADGQSVATIGLFESIANKLPERTYGIVDAQQQTISGETYQILNFNIEGQQYSISADGGEVRLIDVSKVRSEGVNASGGTIGVYQSNNFANNLDQAFIDLTKRLR